jgi:uncharacterized protein (UPF0212 family)
MGSRTCRQVDERLESVHLATHLALYGIISNMSTLANATNIDNFLVNVCGVGFKLCLGRKGNRGGAFFAGKGHV